MSIPLFKTKFHPEAFENVKRVMESGWPGLGPETEAFENEVKEYLGAEYVLGLSSGTEALRLALDAADVGKECSTGPCGVITTPNTFVSTNHVILQAGLQPLFVDIDYDTGSMSYESAQEALRKIRWTRIVAIMVVHFGGMPIDIGKFRKLAKDYNCILIEDCAHAFGATYNDQKVGSTGNYNCFSFHAVKPLALGEGGAFVTDDEKLYQKVKKLRWLGIDKSTHERTKDKRYSWEYDVPLLGYKSHMSDIQAAIGRGQLLHIEEDLEKREELVDRYTNNLLFMDQVSIVGRQAGKASSNHLFVIKLLDYGERDKVIKALTEAGIQFGHHYMNNAKYPIYKGCHKENLKNMELWNETALSLPLNLYMTPTDVDHICNVIEGAF